MHSVNVGVRTYSRFRALFDCLFPPCDMGAEERASRDRAQTQLERARAVIDAYKAPLERGERMRDRRCA